LKVLARLQSNCTLWLCTREARQSHGMVLFRKFRIEFSFEFCFQFRFEFRFPKGEFETEFQTELIDWLRQSQELEI